MKHKTVRRKMPPKRYEQEPRDNRQSFGLITNNRASSAIGNEGMNTTYEGSDWQLNQTVVIMLPYEKKVVSSSMKQHVSKVGGQSFLAFKRDYRRLNQDPSKASTAATTQQRLLTQLEQDSPLLQGHSMTFHIKPNQIIALGSRPTTGNLQKNMQQVQSKRLSANSLSLQQQKESPKRKEPVGNGSNQDLLNALEEAPLRQTRKRKSQKRVEEVLQEDDTQQAALTSPIEIVQRALVSAGMTKSQIPEAQNIIQTTQAVPVSPSKRRSVITKGQQLRQSRQISSGKHRNENLSDFIESDTTFGKIVTPVRTTQQLQSEFEQRSRVIKSYLQDSLSKIAGNEEKNNRQNQQQQVKTPYMGGQEIVDAYSGTKNYLQAPHYTERSRIPIVNIQKSGGSAMISQGSGDGRGAGKDSSMVYVSLPSVLHGGKLSQSGESLANTEHGPGGISQATSKSNLQMPPHALEPQHEVNQQLNASSVNIEESDNEDVEDTISLMGGRQLRNYTTNRSQVLVKRPLTAWSQDQKHPQEQLTLRGESKITGGGGNIVFSNEAEQNATFGGAMKTFDEKSRIYNQRISKGSKGKVANQSNLLEYCFPNSTVSLKQRVQNGSLKRPFCEPVAQRWRDQGLNALENTKGSKSLKRRYQKMRSQMVKLRHLLLNDPETSHEYIFNYLKQHFSIAEIGTFGDDHLKNFISSIISEGERIKIDPQQSMRELILTQMQGNPPRLHRPSLDLPSALVIDNQFSSGLQDMQNKYSGRFEASPINAPIAEAEDNLMSNIDAMELASPPPPIEPEPSPMVAQPEKITFHTKTLGKQEWVQVAPTVIDMPLPVDNSPFLSENNNSVQQSRNPPQVSVAYKHRVIVKNSENADRKTPEMNATFGTQIQPKTVTLSPPQRPSTATAAGRSLRGTIVGSIQNQKQAGSKHRGPEGILLMEKVDKKKSQANMQISETIQHGEDVKQIMYSPLSGRHEIFVRNSQVPKIPHTLGRERHFGLGGYCASTSIEASLVVNSSRQHNQDESSLFTQDPASVPTKPLQNQKIAQQPVCVPSQTFMMPTSKVAPSAIRCQSQIVGTPTRVLREYLNKQDIRLVYEIERPFVKVPPKKECNLSFVTQLEDHNPQMRQIREKQAKDGIMRRNKLLLEHIMHERLQKSISTMNYYQQQSARKVDPHNR